MAAIPGGHSAGPWGTQKSVHARGRAGADRGRAPAVGSCTAVLIPAFGKGSVLPFTFNDM